MTQHGPLSGPAVCANPVFIVGSPRSATSVLAWALAQHTDFWTSGETQVLYALFTPGVVDRVFQSERHRPGGWFKEEGVTQAEFLSYLGLGLNALFSSRCSGRRWVDQTPVYTLMVDLLAEMFPGARFVHILRDGRSIVNSMVNFENSLTETDRDTLLHLAQFPPWATDFRIACRTWAQHVDVITDFAAREPDRCLTVRQEDLLQDPGVVVAALLEFLGAEFDSGPVKYLRENRLHSSFPSNPRGQGNDGASVWARWSLEQRFTFIEEAGHTMVRARLATERELSPLGKLKPAAICNGDAAVFDPTSSDNPLRDEVARRNAASEQIDEAVFASSSVSAIDVIGLLESATRLIENQKFALRAFSRAVESLQVDIQNRRSELAALEVRRAEAQRAVDQLSYEQLVHDVCQLAKRALPPQAVVAVISKGDDALLRLGEHDGHHFPETDAGAYAGYHPADSDEAIRELERQRARGVTHLLIPNTYLWWLEHYTAFREHLDRRYRRLADAEGSFILYDVQAEIDADGSPVNRPISGINRVNQSDGAGNRQPATVAQKESLTRLLTTAPKLHRNHDRDLVTFGLSASGLRYIFDNVDETCSTLETGAGVSTLVFALRGSAHVAITPVQEEASRIQEFCSNNFTNFRPPEFRIGRSEAILPNMHDACLDMALIDGRHGFPAPFIDWFYMARLLKCGGILIIDDVHLWTCAVLRDFLLCDPSWRLDHEFPTTVAFTKLSEGSESREWDQQPFVMARSDLNPTESRPSRSNSSRTEPTTPTVD